MATFREGNMLRPSIQRCLSSPRPTLFLGKRLHGYNPARLSLSKNLSVLGQQRRSIAIATASQFNAAKTPAVSNEPTYMYASGDPGRKKLLQTKNDVVSKLPVQMKVYVDGKPIEAKSGTGKQSNPGEPSMTLIEYPNVAKDDVDRAIGAALDAKEEWQRMSFADRAAIFLKAADLVSGKYRNEMLVATMLGQGKTVFQAEIDCAAELADFLRFNVKYAEDLYSQQPEHNSRGCWNRLEYRPLEGFVYAITPFNFTAIAGNLPAAPALMGNVVIWKPSPHAMLSNHLLHQILLEAGLPENVIQLVQGDPQMITDVVLDNANFAALHYTGSTAVFKNIFAKIGQGIATDKYRTFPRVVGETGGKNFHLVHSSADVRSAVLHTIRAAFEYQGQKCSALSRAYVSSQIWPEFQRLLTEEIAKIRVGSVFDLQNFMGPVIHQGSYDRLTSWINAAKNDDELELLCGGTYTDPSAGFFVHPTVYRTTNPTHKIMSTELFGPVLSIYVYDDPPSTSTPSDRPYPKPDNLASLPSICQLISETTAYGLTGSIFASSRPAIRAAEEHLRDVAGNFYVNTKCTGAVVGQQAFGGARMSGTNDKAGSANLISRFVSMRSVKEEWGGLEAVGYPHMEKD
ncbi:delta-1-pyrroline-5-carboxylate dehydrogenase 1 [Eremomyces bilateralis CBS 781.70]|uniref:Multifunctional fusion protein n=1 Tax=Eremomyces bilateralis CBS 781.70 TaxID=1392243 RepID=A0A6G1GHC1_9PEZI|nr:delta-1-pyrroline-5-carboxylate dehydrogenase 1 [Eremomyces bilateralis CBS 781.70]KAF1817269.1 delta-1-pyrroline-5-carboxylate dehydrogenase 1 [Eremomyces bilateralis CBS 781.70]